MFPILWILLYFLNGFGDRPQVDLPQTNQPTPRLTFTNQPSPRVFTPRRSQQPPPSPMRVTTPIPEPTTTVPEPTTTPIPEPTTTVPEPTTTPIPEPTTTVPEPTTTPESTKITTCPNGWSAYAPENKCIRVFKNKKNWAKSRKFCKDRSGDLVTIRDQATEDLVKSLSGKDRYWIGLHDKPEDGVYSWLDETDEVSFTAWGKNGPPALRKGYQHCVELVGSRGAVWNDRECTKRRAIICERPGQ